MQSEMRVGFIGILAFMLLQTPCWSEKTESNPVKPTSTLETTPPVEEPRDPFWPIGYREVLKKRQDDMKVQDKALLKEPEVEKVPVAWPSIELKGISKALGGKYIAILNGIGVVETGDVVKKEHDGVIYRWKINAITEKGLSHTQMDARPATRP